MDFINNWTAVTWGVIALILIVAEILVPGAFLLWMGFAALVMFVLLLLAPGLPILMQILLFAVFSLIFIQIYRKYFRKQSRDSDQPLLNRRADQLVGQSFTLATDIRQGRGSIRVGDAIWSVTGDDQAAGTQVRIVGVDGMDLRVVPAA